MKRYKMMQLRNLSLGVFSLLFLSNCDPLKKEYYEVVDYNSLRYIINENHSISTFRSIVDLTSYRTRLGGSEKFTIIAPTDDAFRREELNRNNMSLRGSQFITQMIENHILTEHLNLEELQYMTAQRLYTASGMAVYVNKWLKDGKDFLTINGITLDSVVYNGSNGKIYLINQILPSRDYFNVVDALQDHVDFSLFARAIQLAELEDEIKALSFCTLYVPSNSAMANAGYGDFQSLESQPVHKLRELVYSHIQLDGVFVGNLAYTLNLEEAGEYEVDVSFPWGVFSSVQKGKRGATQVQNMASKQMVLEYTEANPGGYHAFRFRLLDASSRGANINPSMKDIPSSNGIIHEIDKVLVF